MCHDDLPNCCAAGGGGIYLFIYLELLSNLSNYLFMYLSIYREGLLVVSHRVNCSITQEWRHRDQTGAGTGNHSFLYDIIVDAAEGFDAININVVLGSNLFKTTHAIVVVGFLFYFLS